MTRRTPARLRRLATRWWVSDGTDTAFDEVLRIERDDHAVLPALISALVATAPQGVTAYVGTTLVESLAMDVERGDLPAHVPLDLVLAAGLDRGQLFAVLSGAYADLLRTIDAGERLVGHLTRRQIDWLLDDAAPHRWPKEGVVVAHDDDIQFIPGATEWQRRL
jgi:hypothetical protein